MHSNILISNTLIRCGLGADRLEIWWGYLDGAGLYPGVFRDGVRGNSGGRRHTTIHVKI